MKNWCKSEMSDLVDRAKKADGDKMQKGSTNVDPFS